MKIGQSASQTTTENIRNFKQQAEEMNWGYDWDREFSTSSPEYYKWTQRLFTELFKVGLVYKKETYQNRCSSCQTVLANDQVIEGKCERCDTEIIKKPVPQRFIKITDYADRLIEDLEEVDRPEETKRAQINWI
jgi:leucyl-tRNA synthetase